MRTLIAVLVCAVWCAGTTFAETSESHSGSVAKSVLNRLGIGVVYTQYHYVYWQRWYVADGAIHERDVSYGVGTSIAFSPLLSIKLGKKVVLEPSIIYSSEAQTGYSFHYVRGSFSIRKHLNIAGNIPYVGYSISYVSSGDKGDAVLHEVVSRGNESALAIGGEVFIREYFTIGAELRYASGEYNVKVKRRDSGSVRYRDTISSSGTQAMITSRIYFGKNDEY